MLVHAAGTIYERALRFFDGLHTIRRLTPIDTPGTKTFRSRRCARMGTNKTGDNSALTFQFK